MSTAQDFLDAFSSVEQNYCTGGNCSAWRIALYDGWEILITCADDEDDGSIQPTDDSRRVVISVYDANADRLDFEDEGALSWSDAIRITRDFITNGVLA